MLDDRSAIGSMIKYITEESKDDFQPMQFGMIRALENPKIRDKKERYNKISNIALEYLEEKLK